MASKLSDIFLGLSPSMKIGGQSTVATLSPSAVPFTPVNRNLPLGGGSYSSPVVAQPQTPVHAKAPAMVMPQAGVQSPTQPTSGVSYDKYRDPVTGRILSPQEYADYLARRVSSGSVPGYAGDAMTGAGMETRDDIATRARVINNERNDIATGTTDPYSVASKSGIAYSPAEMAAIEKAYAGIYDPVLNDVFNKLDKKDKEEAASLENKNKLAQMAKQFEYDLALKQTPAGGTGTGSYTGVYTPGENPTVDAWAQRIFEGSSKITDIPASDKGLRNAVTVALQSFGNQADGRPTTTEIGKQTLDAAKRLMTLFTEGKGTAAVGTSRIFGGGIGLPGSDVTNFKNLYNTLIANRSLEGVKFLKGQGAVSDAERETLKAAMSELNLNQGEDAFKTSLQQIIDKLEGNYVTPGGSTGGAVLRSPDGTQEVSIADLTPAELEEAKSLGWR